MEIARSKEGISVSQRKYTLDLLAETGMLGCRPTDTSIEFNAKLGIQVIEFLLIKKNIGAWWEKLIYLSHTRPNISLVVSTVSQFMHAPYVDQMEAVNRILRYLKATLGKGLRFWKTDKSCVEAYTNSD